MSKRAFTLQEVLLVAALSLTLLAAVVPAVILQSRAGVRVLHESSLFQRGAMILSRWDQLAYQSTTESIHWGPLSSGSGLLIAVQTVPGESNRSATTYQPKIELWSWRGDTQKLSRSDIRELPGALTFSANAPLELDLAGLNSLYQSRPKAVLLSPGVTSCSLSRLAQGLLHLSFELTDVQSDGTKNHLSLERSWQPRVR